MNYCRDGNPAQYERNSRFASMANTLGRKTSGVMLNAGEKDWTPLKSESRPDRQYFRYSPRKRLNYPWSSDFGVLGWCNAREIQPQACCYSQCVVYLIWYLKREYKIVCRRLQTGPSDVHIQATYILRVIESHLRDVFDLGLRDLVIMCNNWCLLCNEH